MGKKDFLAAIKFDNSSMLKWAVENEDVNLDEEIMEGMPPLMLATMWRHAECVKLLLELGANPDIEIGGFTPLMVAIQEDMIEIVMLFINKANVNHRGPDGLTPLMCAARDGKIEMAKLLLANGADIEAKTDKGSDIFDIAKHFGHNDVINLLNEYKSSITKLIDKLWLICPQPVADSDEEVNKWQNDYYLWYTEFAKIVRPLPQEYGLLVDTAISYWNNREKKMFKSLGNINRTEFLTNFSEIRTAAVKDQNYHQLIHNYGRICYAVVNNVEWIHAFSWMLPSADPASKKRYLEIAKVMVAAMYIELLWKYKFDREELLPENIISLNEFNKMEALYRLAYNSHFA